MHSKNWYSELTNTITRLIHSLNKPLGTIRTLLASRNEIDIRDVLAEYPSIFIAATSGDLRLYVHSETKNLSIQDRDLKDHIIKVLIDGADGMYDSQLSATLMIEVDFLGFDGLNAK